MNYEELVAYAKGVVDGRPVNRHDIVRFMSSMLTQLGESVPEEARDGALNAIERGNLARWHDEVQVTSGKMHIAPAAVRTYTRSEAQDLAAHIDAVSQILE